MTAAPVSREMVAPLGPGLLLMALFTTGWAVWPLSNRLPLGFVALTVAFCAVAVVLAANGIALIRSLRDFAPAEQPAAFADVGRKYNIIVAGEVVAIAVSTSALGSNGFDRLIPSAIALIVGLHYIALRSVFDGPLYLWMGGSVSIVAGLALVIIARDADAQRGMSSVVEFAVATSTAGFGLSMLRAKRDAQIHRLAPA